jgi:hypothetical protein
MIQMPRFITGPGRAHRVHVSSQAGLPVTLRLGVCLLVLLTTACDQAGTSTALPVPTAPPSKLVTFSGTLQPLTTISYPITVTQSGYVEATLVGLGAPPDTTVRLGIGNQTATGACSLIYSVTTAAGTEAQIVGTGLAGTLCVAISDVGTLTGPTLYTITVASS